MISIRKIQAQEVLDSRGQPTVEVSVELAGGVIAEAQVPSGASTGRHEAVELRDGDATRYAGKGVLRAVENVENVIAPELAGWPADDQVAIDNRMKELDGTPNKSRLGANAILGVSCAIARAAAQARRLPLWDYLAGGRNASIPLPMINILSGGLHAQGNFEFQDFLAIPHGFSTFRASLEAAAAIHREARNVLDRLGCLLTGVADEGGWGPHLPANGQALEVMTEAIQRAGFSPGRQVSIAIDVASSHFYAGGLYDLRSEGRTLSPDEMIDALADWAERFPILSIEDGLHEDDWEGWIRLTGRLGSRAQLVGDDFFTTNPSRLERGIRRKAGNAVLVKMNQIGTLTETFEVIDRAREAGFQAVISARSGETEDSFLADLVVASGAGQIKVGSITRSERLSKYNRLLCLERTSGLSFAGSAPLAQLIPTH